MKKLLFAGLLILGGTFAKAQTISNFLNSPGCDIEVEVYCVLEGDCGALPGGTGGTCPIGGPSNSFTIAPNSSQSVLPFLCIQPPCAASTEWVYRIRILKAGVCGAWIEWFGVGSCRTQHYGDIHHICTDCGTNGGNTHLDVIFDYFANGDVDVFRP